MPEARSEVFDDNVHKIRIFRDGAQLSFGDVIHQWQTNHEFRTFYVSILRNSSFEAYFWEHPPLVKSNLKQGYEFVLVDSLQLSKTDADPAPFLTQFKTKTAGQSVIAFENLGRDARLVVPCPISSESKYAHLASFVRNAPEEQAHELLVVMADSLNGWVNDKPIWLSTSGLGVYWLHIRLDSRPKYYSFQAYKQFSGR